MSLRILRGLLAAGLLVALLASPAAQGRSTAGSGQGQDGDDQGENEDGQGGQRSRVVPELDPAAAGAIAAALAGGALLLARRRAGTR